MFVIELGDYYFVISLRDLFTRCFWSGVWEYRKEITRIGFS